MPFTFSPFTLSHLFKYPTSILHRSTRGGGKNCCFERFFYFQITLTPALPGFGKLTAGRRTGRGSRKSLVRQMQRRLRVCPSMLFRRRVDIQIVHFLPLLHKNLLFSNQFQQGKEDADHFATAFSADDQLLERQAAIAF